MKTYSRIGAIGDVHAEDFLLQAAVRLLRQRDVDIIVCTGDVVDGPGAPDACCDLLTRESVLTVRGNHDRWFLSGAMRDLPEATAIETMPTLVSDFLRSLPPTAQLHTPDGSLLLCHGLGDNDMGRLGPDDYGYAISSNDELQSLIRDPNILYVLNGHTHQPMVRHFPGLTVINAGTLASEQHPCFVILDFTSHRAEIHRLAKDGGVVSFETAPLRTTR